MAENENNDVETETDIFQQQKKVIDTLVNELARQGQAQTQPVYVSQVAEPKKETPNYILYAAMAVIAILLFKNK